MHGGVGRVLRSGTACCGTWWVHHDLDGVQLSERLLLSLTYSEIVAVNRQSRRKTVEKVRLGESVANLLRLLLHARRRYNPVQVRQSGDRNCDNELLDGLVYVSN